jgi:hypothetical protein
MSKKLSIEILREKFKEAQAKGEELILLDDLNHERSVLYVGDIAIFVKYKHKSKDEYSIHKSHLYNWKIKQPKDKYEVVYEYTYTHYELGQLLALNDKNDIAGLTGRKLLRNTRTGEIVEYDEDLLK